MKIELATLSDIPELCDLLESLFDQEIEFKSNPELQRKGLKAIIQDKHTGEILVVRKEQKIIAMVNLLYTVSTFLGSRVGILEDMVVSKSFRGSGVGSFLLDKALKFAKEQGCQRITLLTDRDNLKAHEFYEKHGFNQSEMVVFRKTN